MRPISRMAAVLVVLMSAGCASPQDPAADPAAFIAEYVRLHRAGDVDGLLALHTADSEFLIPGQAPIHGTAALRDLFAWDAVLGAELAMAGIRALGDTILVDSLVERSRWFQAIGLAEVRYRPGTRMVLYEGRIAATRPAAFEEETRQRLTARFQAFMQWLGQHHPEAGAQLLPGGQFRYDAASARRWLELLTAWNAAQRSDEAGPQ